MSLSRVTSASVRTGVRTAAAAARSAVIASTSVQRIASASIARQTPRSTIAATHTRSSHSSSSSSSSTSSASASSAPLFRGVWSLLLSGCTVVGAAYLLVPMTDARAAAATPLEEARKIAASEGAAKPPAGGWPKYTPAQISEHATPADRIWVSFRDGVYDITDFISQHPGGASKVMLGAGGPIDPFWSLYRQHDHESVRTLLAKYRIGTLEGYDDAANQAALVDPFAEDPKRHRALKVSSAKPFNAEPPLDVLGENYITPNDLFFIRNHLPVPHIDEEEYRLVVNGEGLRERTYTLRELREAFPAHQVTSTLQCAGNRRSEMNAFKQVKGLGWGSAAISNAEWKGVKLRDVLVAHGLDPTAPHSQNVRHVHFDGLDSDITGMTYRASIPIEKVLDGSSDVILAYEMNGEALPLDHGYPLRAIVPGVVGARNVKWLGRVATSPVESPGHWQQNDYKGFSPNIDWSNVDFTTAPAIQELPVTSAITEPAANTNITVGKDGKTVKVKGYAWSGGGRGIVRVDVSPDGVNWHTAKLQPKPAGEPQSLNRSWAWTQWSLDLPIDVVKQAAKDGQTTLMCKAIDSSYNNQPENYAPIWNLRGCASNAWHKVPVKVHAAGEAQQQQKKQ